MSRSNVPREFPNARVRLRRVQRIPGLPVREGEMQIWLNGTRFRVLDEAGRHLSAILADLSAASGLGAVPRSLEEMMDIQSESRIPVDGVTDLSGDLATDEGWVRRKGQPAWPARAGQLAPAAAQILAGELAGLEPGGEVLRLGRTCTEYQGVREGVEDGTPYRSAVTYIVSPPYLLFSDVHDADDADHSYTCEILSLEEGAAADADLALPSGAGDP
jgi:hypothetical protein